MRKLSKYLAAGVFLVAVYAGSYVVFRFSHIEKWEKDDNEYVIFPKDWPAVYYFYRPLTYLDGLATGMTFHIGPHR